ncbi:hypothetical protein D3C84_1219910 [compost metagenome]
MKKLIIVIVTVNQTKFRREEIVADSRNAIVDGLMNQCEYLLHLVRCERLVGVR